MIACLCLISLHLKIISQLIVLISSMQIHINVRTKPRFDFVCTNLLSKYLFVVHYLQRSKI